MALGLKNQGPTPRRSVHEPFQIVHDDEGCAAVIMDLLGFLGPLLLGTGPLLVVFLLVISRQAFLIVSTLIR